MRGGSAMVTPPGDSMRRVRVVRAMTQPRVLSRRVETTAGAGTALATLRAAVPLQHSMEISNVMVKTIAAAVAAALVGVASASWAQSGAGSAGGTSAGGSAGTGTSTSGATGSTGSGMSGSGS